MKAKREVARVHGSMLSDPALRKILEVVDRQFSLLGDDGLPAAFKEGLLAEEPKTSKDSDRKQTDHLA